MLCDIPSGIYLGDVVDIVATWPAKFIHVCVSSPPYWNLRDYGVPPRLWPEIRFRLNEWSPEIVVPEMTCCLGLEPDPVSFVAHLVHIYRLIRPCLRDDALVWVNLGDSFCKSGGRGSGNHSRKNRAWQQQNLTTKPAAGLKAKDLVGVPWLFANAMRADGWHFRGDSIWCKRSPMPESVDGTRWEQHMIKVADEEYNRADVGYALPSGWNTSHTGSDLDGNHNGKQKKKKMAPCPGCSKCSPNGGLILRRGNWRHTRGHEYVFQFAKTKHSFSDAQAVAEPVSGGAHSRGHGLNPKAADDKTGSRDRQNADFSTSVTDLVLTRNPRSFYVLSTEPSKEKHFAAYPKRLILPFIQASTSAGGYCKSCGAPVVRIVERVRVPTRTGKKSKVHGATTLDPDSPYQAQEGTIVGNRDPQRHVTEKKTVGWRPTCQCEWMQTEPAIVFDPFSGTGTTAVVAKSLGLRFLGTELNPRYNEISTRKIDNALPVGEVVESRPRKKSSVEVTQLDLF